MISFTPMRLNRAKAAIALESPAGLLLVVGIVVTVVELAGVDAYVKSRVLPAWSRKIGRRMTVKEVRTRLLPRLHAQLTA